MSPIKHHDEAVAFAQRALYQIGGLLPGWAFNPAGWSDPIYIVVDDRPLSIVISPWNEARQGRGFKIWPTNTTPAGVPRCDGFFKITTGGLEIYPDLFRRPRRRKQRPTL